MTVYYLEASALLKRYKSETGSDVVAELFQGKTADEVLVTSHLSVLEVNSVAARLLRGQAIRQRQYDRMVGTLVEDISAYNVVVLPLHSALVSDAIELLPEHPLRTGDALHFATAVRVSHGSGGRPFYVVVSDRDVRDACANRQLNYINPEDPNALDQLRSLRSTR